MGMFHCDKCERYLDSKDVGYHCSGDLPDFTEYCDDCWLDLRKEYEKHQAMLEDKAEAEMEYRREKEHDEENS